MSSYTIEETMLTITNKSSQRLKSINLDNCIGFIAHDETLQVEMNEHSLKTNGTRTRVRHLLQWDNQQTYSDIKTKLEDYFEFEKQKQRSLYIIINPFSGNKNAQQNFHTYVAPMLNEAHIRYECITTVSKDHVRTITEELSLRGSELNEIVIFAGDGLLHEMINIVNQWDKEKSSKFFQDFSLAIIPGGSANCTASAALMQRGWHGHTTKICLKNSVFLLIKGSPTVISVCENVLDGKQTILSLEKSAIGYTAELTINAENYRWLGTSRYQFAAAGLLFSNKFQQTPQITITPVSEEEWPTEYAEYKHKRMNQISDNRIFHSEDSKETIIAPEITNITFHNNPSFGETIDPDGIPFLKLQDPFFTVLVMKSMTRLQFFNAFRLMTKGQTQWIYYPRLETTLAKSCTVQFDRNSIITIDGEKYECKLWEISLSQQKIKFIL